MQPRQPPESPTLWEEHENFRGLLQREFPEFEVAVYAVNANAIPFVRGFLTDSRAYRAAAVIFNQATNDYMELLEDLLQGRGRSSIRAARALVEHSVNLATVMSSQQAAERYLAHLDVAHDLRFRVQMGADLMARRDRRSYLHRLRKARNEAADRVESAITRYGSSFRRSWSEMNLLDRAEMYGLRASYDFYRLASLVMHGAAGGLLGSIRDVQGEAVYRTGPAIELLPGSYLQGVRSYIDVLELAAPAKPLLDVSTALETNRAFLEIWDDYRAAIERIDKSIWPTTPPRHPDAIALISRSGKVRWYWHEPDRGLLIEALPPTVLSEETQRQLDVLIEKVTRSPEEMFRPQDQWSSVRFTERIVVTPKPDARMVSDTAFMLGKDEVNLRQMRRIG